MSIFTIVSALIIPLLGVLFVYLLRRHFEINSLASADIAATCGVFDLAFIIDRGGLIGSLDKWVEKPELYAIMSGQLTLQVLFAGLLYSLATIFGALFLEKSSEIDGLLKNIGGAHERESVALDLSYHIPAITCAVFHIGVLSSFVKI